MSVLRKGPPSAVDRYPVCVRFLLGRPLQITPQMPGPFVTGVALETGSLAVRGNAAGPTTSRGQTQPLSATGASSPIPSTRLVVSVSFPVK